MKKIGLICAVALAGMSLAACGSQTSKKASSSSKTSSSKVVKHHKKQNKKKQSSSSSASSNKKQTNQSVINSQDGSQQQNVSSSQLNQSSSSTPSTGKGANKDAENLLIHYSDHYNDGTGLPSGSVNVYYNGNTQDAENYAKNIGQQGGTGDYHMN